MSEQENQVNNEFLASDTFNELIKLEHEKAFEKKTYVSGAGVTPEQQAILDKWLNSKDGKQEINDIIEKKERVNLGYVTSTLDVGNATRVFYVRDDGQKTAFDYNKDKECFDKVGEEGFKEGQIIVNELEGNKMKSVYPVDLDPDSKLELLERMKEKNETYGND